MFVGTSGKVDVDNVDSGEIRESATYSNKVGNLTGAGVLANGDILNYTYNGSYRTITLPRGTYKFELWGARGGGCGNNNGGKGGYAYGNVNITANTTYYIYCGGVGKNSTSSIDRNSGRVYAGGFNGGGTGSGSAGPGGGGGTDIRTGGTSTSNRIIAAAGGGGGVNQANSSVSGSNGTLYQGTHGCTSRHSSRYYNDEGGGGGGWYGGKSDHGDDPRRGYAGTNGINTSYFVAGTYNTASYGVNADAGKVKITVINVNQNPTSANKTISVGTRRTGLSIDIKSDARRFTGTSTNVGIANDPDATKTNLYFSDGTASNYDTCNSSGRSFYLNSACTQSASSYIDTTYVNNETIRITSVKRYPANGKLTLYAKVRDSFGSSNSRGFAAVSFTISVTDNAIVVQNYSNFTNKTNGVAINEPQGRGQYVEYTYGTGDNAYKYRLGQSDSTNKTQDFMSGHIYNEATGRTTVFIPMPLTTNRTSGFTVYASDIFRDPDTAYDTVGFKTVSSSSYTSYYGVTLNTNTSKYGSSGLGESITIKPTNLRPNTATFVVLTVAGQSYEKNGSAVIGSTNTIYLVFKIANTRPYYATTTVTQTGLTEPVLNMTVGESKDVIISNSDSKSFIKDPDGNNPTFVTSGAAGSFIKIPQNEYISVTIENSLIGLAGNSNYAANNIAANIVADSKTTGEGKIPTGFANSAIYNSVLAAAGSAEAANACITYQYVNSTTLRFTARAATQYMYSQDGRAGDFYVLVRVNDPGDTSDNGIWYPIALKVSSSAPHEPTTTANFTLDFDYTAGDASNDAVSLVNGTVGEERGVAYLTPVSYTDANGTLKGIGCASKGDYMIQSRYQAQPFVTDDDVFSYGSGKNNDPCTFTLNEIIGLNGNTVAADGTVVNPASAFFNVEVVKLYAAKEVFDYVNGGISADVRNKIGLTDEGSGVYSFYGLKVTALRSTGNYYYEFDVNVIDSHGSESDSPIRVYVKVNNRGANLRRSETDLKQQGVQNDYTEHAFNTTSKGAYNAYSAIIGSSYINYTIEAQDVLYITPYDLVYDLDLADILNKKTGNDISHGKGLYDFNTNPSDTGFAQAVSAINAVYKVKRTETPSVAAVEADVTMDKLSFVNGDTIVSSAKQYESYFTTEVVNTVTASDGKNYSVPAIKITGVSRTAASVLTLRFAVSDGMSSVNCVIAVTVKNAAPSLAEIQDIYTFKAGDTKEFTVGNLAIDKDNDRPSFVSGSVRIVAKTGNGDTEADYATSIVGQYGNDPANTTYNLSDYITAILTKSTTSGQIGVDVIYITALSSTQLFDHPIYLEFKVTDGYRAQPQTATLHVPLEVLNSDSEMLTDNLAAEFIEDSKDEYNYYWNIEFETAAEKRLSRYIVNSEELYNSSAINASPANKMLLFKDIDAQQRTLLNPAAGFSNAAGGDGYKTGLVATSPTYVNEEAFTSSDLYRSAAVIYTPAYVENTGSNNDYLSVSVMFFKKNVDGSFEEITNVNSDEIPTSKYWALKIVDNGSNSSGSKPAQFAIAVRDDHHGNTVYTGADRTESTGDSDVTVINFFYQYLSPGLTAMHEYYRTDGTAEAATEISDGVFAVGYNTVHASYQYSAKAGTSVSDQDSLVKNAVFTDDFKYQYFVNSKIDGDDIKLTSKIYPSAKAQAFYYKPIEIEATGNKIVPISYIAMPTAYSVTGGTEGSNIHVTLGNATTVPSEYESGKYSLLDSGYADWGTGSNKTEAEKRRELNAVFANLTLTDGKEQWTGADINENPYIVIDYNGKIAVPSVGEESYINRNRGVVADGDKFGPNMSWLVDGKSIFREDKYGFTISKRNDGQNRRPTGALKLIVSLRTSETQSVPQDVTVDVIVNNTTPGQAEGSRDGYSTLDVDMTVSDTSGKYVELLTNKREQQITTGKGYPSNSIVIKGTDSDGTDILKFYLPSATDKSLAEEFVNNPAELAHIARNNAQPSSAAFQYYFGHASANDATVNTDLVPNPGYKKFFTVSPGTGSSTILQFTPIAKTELVIPQGATESDYLAANNLKKDAGGIYYPFKILFYDDLDGTGFTNGYWQLAIIKVYINNDPIRFSGVKTENVNRYDFTLTKGVNFSVDVTSLLTDNDIVLQGQSFATADDDAWQDLTNTGNAVETNERLVKDYIVMPVAAGWTGTGDKTGVDFGNKVQVINGDATPLDVNVFKTAPTSIVFNAKSGFNVSIDIEFTFMDSAGTSEKIVFHITYQNEAPTANADTYGNSNLISVVMKTGDSFTLYAADPNVFSTDKSGGYKSPAEFEALNGKDAEFGSYIDSTAQEAKDAFKFYTTDSYPQNNVGDLGDLILGSDDASSTLRFTYNPNSRPMVGEFGDATQTNKFNVVAQNFMRTEQALLHNSRTPKLPMSVTLTARGVVTNAVYTITLTDGELTTQVRLLITVVSSAPVPNMREYTTSDKLTITPVDELGINNPTYRLDMHYGDVFKAPLRAIATDADNGDDSNFFVPSIYDGTQFKTTNPEGISAVAPATTEESTVQSIVIRAVDYIPVNGEFSSVTFRISDAHGAQSEEITIRVYVAPKEAEVEADLSHAADIAIRSYADYANDGAAEIVELVSGTKSDAKVIYDADVNAPSALYDVEVYALLQKNGEVFNEITANNLDKNSTLIVKRMQAHGNDPARDENGDGGESQEIYRYVNRFFKVTISEDGKTISFDPKAATITGSGANVGKIKFYVIIGKQYENGNDYVMPEKNAYLNVSVSNSKPVAVEATALNYGYPQVKQGEMSVMRESEFLTFEGSAGSSLTWSLYNKDERLDENFGLFYDHDMLNGGNDTLSFVSAKVLPQYTVKDENGQTVVKQTVKDAIDLIGKDPVLTVSESNGNITIKINRKVRIGQPGKDGVAPYTDVPVEIACVDTLGNRAADKYAASVKTVIMVRVTNDAPEFKEVVYDVSRGYYVTYSEVNGYELFASVPTDSTLVVNLADIIDDKDVAMDAYFFNTSGGSNRILSDETTAITIDGGNAQLFAFSTAVTNNAYGISTMSSLRFKSTSRNRGAESTCLLQLYDSTMKATTSMMTIHLTVGNTAPVKKTDNIELTVMGIAADGEISESAPYSILDFVTDINPNDAVDATISDSKTYIYIDNILVRTKYSDIDPPEIRGPNSTIEEEGHAEILSVCDINWADNDKHQKFSITLQPGIYGTQKAILTVSDSGYLDGAMAFVEDGLTTEVEITITVVCPFDEMTLPEFAIANKVTRKITAERLLNAASGDDAHNADGYTLKSIEVKDAGLLTATQKFADESAYEGKVSTSAAEFGEWYITANSMSLNGEPAVITATFDVGGAEYSQDFGIVITKNNAPVMTSDPEVGIFTKDKLNDRNMITIEPEMWFTDEDVDDVMRFVSPVKVKASAYADAYLDGRNIVISFKGRGKTTLTFNITDATGTLYGHTIDIGCTDMDELSFFNRIVATVQENPIMYGIIAGGVLLLIIILIIIIVVVRKKKKMRDEIEALLNSEAEFEEEMMRLSQGASAGYQSFGYLPPTSYAANDPNLMLNGSPKNPTPNNLQLGAGTGQQPPTDGSAAPNMQQGAPRVSNIPTDNGFGQGGSDGFDPNDF